MGVDVMAHIDYVEWEGVNGGGNGEVVMFTEG